MRLAAGVDGHGEHRGVAGGVLNVDAHRGAGPAQALGAQADGVDGRLKAQ